MPWEKSFDESDVLDQVMTVFWEKGYAATSISDITEATGLKRGSLYNAFDGKDDLFMRSLLKYDTERRRKKLDQLEELDNPREAISKFFDYLVNDSITDPVQKGCLLVNTSLDCSRHSEEVQAVVKEAFKDVSLFFERQIKRGQESGDVPESVSIQSTAKTLVALIVGIRVLGRGTFGKTALLQIAEQAKQLIT
ncbi:HTH-type transcriptional repressor ComR [Polystyrenella longa]|uniref:HTH-type transcriptional repressor ComR n=1 Tax=Polystyrenella longa TaxID=2528007 RepID=A0A518CM06_9PLAN|nr:TetR/AcrR family transcriptional regulator [Polystyrenella longa]QDU80255.1 HTH-type transcriptional repressor ComR [Polystyrenella longa]